MKLRDYGLIVFALIFAAVCVRLGIWQLDRLAQRRALNAVVARRLAAAPVALAALPHDTAQLHYRHVRIRGVYDYAHQVVLTDRVRNGSPGVDVVTPVHVAGSDTAVLVNRGWVYAADGVHTDMSAWREGDSVNAVGYVEPFARGRNSARVGTAANRFRWLDGTALASVIPYPVAPFSVVLESSGPQQAHVPPRIPPPTLDEGPHQSYAIQWFAFATIAIVGMGFFLTQTRRAKG